MTSAQSMSKRMTQVVILFGAMLAMAFALLSPPAQALGNGAWSRTDNASCRFQGATSSGGAASTSWLAGDCLGRYSVAAYYNVSSGGRAYLTRQYGSSGRQGGVGWNYGRSINGGTHYACDSCGQSRET